MSKIIIRAIMEVLGTPQEHVEKSSKLLLDKIKETKGIEVVKSYISDAKETKVSDKQPENIKFFSVVVECELGFENIDKVVGFCFDFMPSSIDILEPSNLQIDAREMNAVINDLMARLHRYDMFVKNMTAHTKMLQKELEKKKSQ